MTIKILAIDTSASFPTAVPTAPSTFTGAIQTQLNTVATGSFTIANVKFNGANGTGITDDGPAIVSTHNIAATTAPGTITYLPSGTYGLLTSITVAQPNTHFMGESREKTVIKLLGNLASGAVFEPTTTVISGGLGSLVVENMTIDLQGSKGFGGYCFFGITAGHQWSSVTFRNCVIKDLGFHGQGFLLRGSSNVTLENIDCYGIGAGTVSGSTVGQFVIFEGDCYNTNIINCSGRLLNAGISSVGINVNTNVVNWNWDGCIFTAPSCLSGTGSTVTYTAKQLQDTSIAHFNSASAGFPGGIICRVLETRVTGTISSVDAQRRFILNDNTNDFRNKGILEQELIRSPKPPAAPLYEMNVVQNGLESGSIHGDGWRDVYTGGFVPGPAAGDSYIVHRMTLGQPSYTTGSIAEVSYWFGMDGDTTHIPASGSRYEFSPGCNYGCHVASGIGKTIPDANNWRMTNCVGKRVIADPYSFWDPATLIGCYGEWSTDTLFTFNAYEGVTAVGCYAYNAVECYYLGSLEAIQARHNVIGCTARRWGWAGGASSINTGFVVLGLEMNMSNCRAFADFQPCAKRGYLVGALNSTILDNKTYDIFPGNSDMQLTAGAPGSISGTFIRHNGTLDFTPFSGNFLGSAILDLTTPIPVINGVVAAQPGSRVFSQADGSIYLKPSGSYGKTGWKISVNTDPPDWSPIVTFGSSAVVSWIRVNGHISSSAGLAAKVDDLGLMSANPPMGLSGQNMQFSASNPLYNNKDTLTMHAGTMMYADWGGTQIAAGHDQTLIFVGRCQHSGGTGDFGYAVTGEANGFSSFGRGGGATSEDLGIQYTQNSPSVNNNAPMVVAVVWDVTNLSTSYYENDATTPARVWGDPGSKATNIITLGGDYGGGAGGFYGEGDIAEVIRINKALSAAEVYEAMIGLSVLYGISITV